MHVIAKWPWGLHVTEKGIIVRITGCNYKGNERLIIMAVRIQFPKIYVDGNICRSK